MGYKLGVTTGLHYVARDEQLATAVKKLGFGLTRGVRSIEIALDVPHEITDTDGKVLRAMAKKQGVDVLMHGSLTIPMGIPERSDWRDAQDHIEKSIRSSIKAGAHYVDFHACLNIWLELMTYTSRKLTMSFCDHEGRFISHILKECEELREWFIKYKGDQYMRDILNREEMTELRSKISNSEDDWYRNAIKERLTEKGFSQEAVERALLTNIFPERGVSRAEMADIEKKYVVDGKLSADAAKKAKAEIRMLEEERKKETKEGQDTIDAIRREKVPENARIEKGVIDDILRNKLSAGDPWESEELRTAQGILDGYHIMAHYMFFTKDPMWIEMAKLYPGLKIDYSDSHWLHDAWRKAEDENDRVFKEFFYGVVAAKYLEGHMKKMLEWMEGKNPKRSMLEEDFMREPGLLENARKLKVGIESPDARDAQHAGLHLLWDTSQIYVAVKVIRQQLKNAGLSGEKIWMLVDFEHVATQGVDPVEDIKKVLRNAPDFGKYCISIHANAPNPTHAHEPLELGDIRVYRLLYFLVKTGFGRDKDVWVIYERGGGEDPFKRSVETLRLMLQYLDPAVDSANPIAPSMLPAAFYGYMGPVAGDEQRQMQQVREHAYEPLKDLLEMPDEEFGMLSKTVLSRGKKPETWKKGELR